MIARLFILIHDSNRRLNQLKEDLLVQYPRKSEYDILLMIKSNFESGYEERYEAKIDPRSNKSTHLVYIR